MHSDLFGPELTSIWRLKAVRSGALQQPLASTVSLRPLDNIVLLGKERQVRMEDESCHRELGSKGEDVRHGQMRRSARSTTKFSN
ncbi:hypothetical protein LMTR13_26910 [Bradyrhizobium icense]|uniref:Uncharacterized protein n=1 Tax=Bradyrhizobium icense TaxID=1274631 RepID=A0A1B1UKI2_9BRAD|nr:hypothetical protein LMTR13_26910 [Bradyrhizobium icense]